MITNKNICIAGVKVPLKTAKNSKDQVYCIINEKYISTKGISKTREIAYRRCIREAKCGYKLCNSHHKLSLKSSIKIFADLLKSKDCKEVLNKSYDDEKSPISE